MSHQLRVVNLLACLALANGGCVELDPAAEDTGAIEEALVAGPQVGTSYTFSTYLPTWSCIDLPPPGLGTMVQVACDYVARQSFDVLDAGGGRVYLRQSSSGKCVTMTGGSIGSKARLASCANLPSQQFSFAVDTDGGVFIQTALSPGYTLNVVGGSTADFTALELFYWTGAASEKWNASESFVTLHPLSNPSSCMARAGLNGANGAALQQSACDGQEEQNFAMVTRSDGLVSLNADYGTCVDLAGQGTANGTAVQLWSCNEGPGQLFQVVRDGSGNVTFKNPNSGRCLDVTGGAQADGTRIQLYDCNGAAAQKWSVR